MRKSAPLVEPDHDEPLYRPEKLPIERLLAFFEGPVGKAVFGLIVLALMISPVIGFYWFYGRLHNGHTAYGWVEQFTLGTGEAVQSARRELKEIGPTSVPALIWGLDHSHDNVRRFSAQYLTDFGESAHAAVPKLAEKLDDPAIGMTCLETLATFGEAAKPAANKLRLLTESKDSSRRLLAMSVLGKIRDTDALPVFVQQLGDKDRFQLRAIEVLGDYGPDAAVAIPNLIQLADSPVASEEVRSAAALSLSRIDVNNDAPRKRWESWLAERDTVMPLRIAAIKGLGSLGEKAKPAVSLVLRGLEDESLIEMSAIVLGEIGEGSDLVISALIAAKDRTKGFFYSETRRREDQIVSRASDRSTSVMVRGTRSAQSDTPRHLRDQIDAQQNHQRDAIWKAASERWDNVRSQIDGVIEKLRGGAAPVIVDEINARTRQTCILAARNEKIPDDLPIEPLFKLLEEQAGEDADAVRIGASRLLVKYSRVRKDVANALLKAMNSEKQPAVAVELIRSLGQLGALEFAEAQFLAERLSANAAEAVAAAEALHRCTPETLRDAPALYWALHLLSLGQSITEGMPPLAPEIQQRLAESLRHLDADGKRLQFTKIVLAKQLLEILHGKRSDQDMVAIQDICRRLKELGPSIVPTIVADKAHNMNYFVFEVLVSFGPEADDAAQLFVNACQTAHLSQRVFPLVGKLGPKAAKVFVPQAIEMLQRGQAGGGFAAIPVLQDFGPLANSAVPELVKFGGREDVVSDSDKITTVRVALLTLQPTWEQLAPFLESQQWGQRAFGLQMVCAISRAEPDRILPLLIVAAKDPMAPVRKVAVEELANLEFRAKKSLPVLRDLLKSPKKSVIDTTEAEVIRRAIDVIEKSRE